jgi:hypothetical protein
VFSSLLTKSVMGHGTAAARFRATDEESRRLLDQAEEIEARHGRPSHEDLAAFFSTDLIGPDRGERMARSLELFWDGQPDESAHVLIPRLESAIREMARRAGLTIIREPIGSEPGGVRTLGTLLLELRDAFPDPPWQQYLRVWGTIGEHSM